MSKGGRKSFARGIIKRERERTLITGREEKGERDSRGVLRMGWRRKREKVSVEVITAESRRTKKEEKEACWWRYRYTRARARAHLEARVREEVIGLRSFGGAAHVDNDKHRATDRVAAWVAKNWIVSLYIRLRFQLKIRA